MNDVANAMPPTPLANPVVMAAQRLGISRAKLYQFIETGELKAIKIGHRTMIAESELVRFVESRSPMVSKAR